MGISVYCCNNTNNNNNYKQETFRFQSKSDIDEYSKAESRTGIGTFFRQTIKPSLSVTDMDAEEFYNKDRHYGKTIQKKTIIPLEFALSKIKYRTFDQNPTNPSKILSQDTFSQKNYELLPNQKIQSTNSILRFDTIKLTESILDSQQTISRVDTVQSVENKRSNIRDNKVNVGLVSTSPFLTPMLGNRKAPIEIVNDALSTKQLRALRTILEKEELISNELDEPTINQIINAVAFLKVKARVTLFSNKHVKVEPNYYFMLVRGKAEYVLDKEKYELPKYSGIGTIALVKNCKQKCSLYTVEKSTFFRLLITTYQKIINNYLIEQNKLKLQTISQNYFFKGLEQSILEDIVKSAIYDKYNCRTLLINQDHFPKQIYVIEKGEVLCKKNGIVVKKLGPNDIFGEIGLFSTAESFYSYSARTNSCIIRISYDSLHYLLSQKSIKHIVYNIYKHAIIENKDMCMYFLHDNNLERMFNVFHLKYYFNETIISKSEYKLLIPIAGTLFKQLSNKKMGYYSIEGSGTLYKHISKLNASDMLTKGMLYNEKVIIDKYDSYPFSIIGDECIVFECAWDDFLRNIIIESPLNYDIPLIQRVDLLLSLNFVKLLSNFKIFQLCTYIKFETFLEGTVILRDGPISEKVFIIKTGKVKVTANQKTLKVLGPKQSFGDICSKQHSYYQTVDCIAMTDVECYYIQKAKYEEIAHNGNKNAFEPTIGNLLNLKDITVTLDSLFFLREVGCGSYGKVYLVHNQKRFYAIKTAEIEQMIKLKAMTELYITEKKILFSIEHPFIVSIINTFKTKEYLLFLMEYVDGITLKKLMSENNYHPRNLEQTKFICACLGSVLSYLQRKKIIHRDLKSENVMITHNGYVKVIDFGAAKNISQRDFAKTFIGTTHYMSPEVIKGNKYGYGVDYWAMGVILYEFFYGMLPFGHGETNQYNVYKKIMEKDVVFPSKKFTALNNLIECLLEKNPKNRLMSFRSIQNHDLFNGFDFDELIEGRKVAPFVVNTQLNNSELSYTDIQFQVFIKNRYHFSHSDAEEFNAQNNVAEFLNNF